MNYLADALTSAGLSAIELTIILNLNSAAPELVFFLT
jgi:hypothetical protein